MVPKFEVQPANSDSFHELLAFAGEILKLCRELSVVPIVYGGLAYLYYTEDESISVRDLDLLVPESAFPDFIRLLDQQNDLTCKLMPYHSLEVFKGDFEIDLDATGHFLGTRSSKTEQVEIAGMLFHMINLESLIGIYQEGLDNMPAIRKLDEKKKRSEYKLRNLKEIFLRSTSS